jgi:hypothetical protein
MGFGSELAVRDDPAKADEVDEYFRKTRFMPFSGDPKPPLPAVSIPVVFP